MSYHIWKSPYWMRLGKRNRANRRKYWKDLEDTLNHAQHIIDDNGLSADACEDIEMLKVKLLKQMKHDVFNNY